MSTVSVTNVVSTTVQATEIKSNSATLPVMIENNAGVEVGWFARAWVNFDGGDGSIRSSANVSSVVRTNTGRYTVNFTNPLNRLQYSCVVGGARTQGSTATDGFRKFYNANIDSVLIETMDSSTGFADHSLVAVVIHS